MTTFYDDVSEDVGTALSYNISPEDRTMRSFAFFGPEGGERPPSIGFMRHLKEMFPEKSSMILQGESLSLDSYPLVLRAVERLKKMGATVGPDATVTINQHGNIVHSRRLRTG